MENISKSKPIARKEHICNYCGQIIHKGEVYCRQLNKMDGDLYTWKNHLKCQDIAEELNMFDGPCDEGLTGESFQEYIRDEYMSLVNEKLETDDKFTYPPFAEQLDFIIRHYLGQKVTRAPNQN